jgi:hypothetical protein
LRRRVRQTQLEVPGLAAHRLQGFDQESSALLVAHRDPGQERRRIEGETRGEALNELGDALGSAQTRGAREQASSEL